MFAVLWMCQYAGKNWCKMKGLLVFGVFVAVVFGQDEDITCTKAYCEDWLDDNTCPTLSTGCQAQNSTHNGLVVPYPGLCNCCDYCLTNIAEGSPCAVGSPSSPTPTSICADGLACDADELVCKRIKTACTLLQDEFDQKKLDGTLGHLEVRPACDRNGLFAPYKCIPGEICYCLSEDGERIFGEIEFSDNAASLLNCECSRAYHTAVELIGQELHPNQYFRCVANGDYDEIQCIGENCYCVNATDGSPTSEDGAKMSAVNITILAKDEIDCFDKDYHTEGYYHKCETQYLEKLETIQDLEDESHEVIGYTLPNCQLDGKYAPVQTNSTISYCSDPDGNVLEDFFVDIDDVLRSTMNCKCARARSKMTADARPTCCKNGNYAGLQCRRGMCRCVDSDGNQIVQEVHYSKQGDLSCYSEDEIICT